MGLTLTGACTSEMSTCVLARSWCHCLCSSYNVRTRWAVGSEEVAAPDEHALMHVQALCV